MKIDEHTTANLFALKNDPKSIQSKDKIPSLPNVQAKISIKVP